MDHRPERHMVRFAVYLVLRRPDGRVLMLRRANTGYMDGKLSLPAGHVDPGEPADLAMTREAQEEIGITVLPEDLQLVHAVHRTAEEGGYEYVDFYFEATKWHGEPVNKEPHKCSELPWEDPEHLPDDVIPVVRQALECITANKAYSSFNFDKA